MNKDERKLWGDLGLTVVRLPDKPGYDAVSAVITDEGVEELIARKVVHRHADEVWVTDRKAFEREVARLKPGCDFCVGDKPARWCYPVAEGVMAWVVGDEGTTEHRDDTAWLACVDCAELIEAGNRDRLAERSARIICDKFEITDHTQKLMTGATVLELHAGFFARREGKRIRL